MNTALTSVLGATRQRRSSVFHHALAYLLFAVGCGGHPTPKASLTQNRELESFRTLAAEPNSEPVVILIAAQEFMGAHREWEGYDYFGKLADEQPDRRPLFRSLQALMQARVANDVPLLKRIAWVNDAIAKLDEGAKADPVLGRFARGLVFSDLPARFEKADQAIEDLQATLEHVDELPVTLHRGIYRGLAAAYRTKGDEARSNEMLKRAGLSSLEDARILGDLSVSPADGFRFSARRFKKEADGVYVAEGYDFGNIAFIVGDSSVVAIDAGTNEKNAAEAVKELRKITQAPIKYLVLTHGHWDHAGGVAAIKEPGTIVVAHSAFPRVLARSESEKVPIHDFFGEDAPALAITPDKLVAARESIAEPGIDLDVIPAPSGETEDALFVFDKKHDLLFVGDAFMPYVGAPFVAEGSPEGYRAAIDTVLSLHPKRLIHGHVPLTDNFTIEAMPGLRDATSALYEHTIAGTRSARPLADVLHDGFVPDSLRSAPKAVMPYLILRDTFVQRVYQQHAGYWDALGNGVDHFTRDEWARSLDLLAEGSDARFVRAVDDLLERGDAAMAFHLADYGVTQHPSSKDLAAARQKALKALREKFSNANPFRFILYSEFSGQSLDPVMVPSATP